MTPELKRLFSPMLLTYFKNKTRRQFVNYIFAPAFIYIQTAKFYINSALGAYENDRRDS